MPSELPLYHTYHRQNVLPTFPILTIFTLLVGPLILLYLAYIGYVRSKPSRHRTAIVLVLGDIGRSPRMMYHTESLAKHGYETTMIGYGGRSISERD
jgi:beta-1,4-mannosyltransferase